MHLNDGASFITNGQRYLMSTCPVFPGSVGGTNGWSYFGVERHKYVVPLSLHYFASFTPRSSVVHSHSEG